MSTFPSLKPKILVIDDEQGTRYALTAILEDEFSVEPFSNGPEAVDYAARQQGQILAAFVDYGMEPMNGAEVCRALQNIDATISLIGFTAVLDADYGVELFAMLRKQRSNVHEVRAVAGRAIEETRRRRNTALA